MKHFVELAVARAASALWPLCWRRVLAPAFPVAVLLLTVAAASAGAQTANDSLQRADSVGTHPLSAGVAVPDSSVRYRPESFASFAKHTLGPLPLLRSTALAGFDQWRKEPVGWMQTSRGFRDRLDSRLGGDVLGHSIRFAFERAMQEQPSKYRGCQCEGFEPRLAYALLSPLRVETPHGQQLSAVLPLGVIVSALAVTSVHPGGFSLARGLESGAGGVASAALTPLVREFWPWHWRPPGL